MKTLNDIHGATDDEISGYLEIVETKEFRQHVAEFSGEQRTLRDWFAGMAISPIYKLGCGEITEPEMAADAYRIADEMLAARKEAR